MDSIGGVAHISGRGSGRKRVGMRLLACGFVLWLVAPSAKAQMSGGATYSDISVGSDGTVHAWAVTDGTSSCNCHDSSLGITLTSPNGRTSSGSGQGVEYASGDAYLPFDPTDLGGYFEETTHHIYCPIAGAIILAVVTNGSISEPSATIPVHFTGSKTTGDNLTFPNNATCSQGLGLFNCTGPQTWAWNVEVQARVSDDASQWNTQQSFTGRMKGYYKDSNGNLVSFDDTLSQPNDNPDSHFVQQPSGQTTIFWIDAPGHFYTYSGYPVDSLTQVENFSSWICSRRTSRVCRSVNWYLKLIVTPGAVLDTANSKANFGSASTAF